LLTVLFNFSDTVPISIGIKTTQQKSLFYVAAGFWKIFSNITLVRIYSIIKKTNSGKKDHGKRVHGKKEKICSK